MANVTNKPTVIDLFAGAGGLSSSLEAVGWHTLAAVDSDAAAIATLRANQARGHLKGAQILQADVRALSAAELMSKGAKLDLLAGGPPCQPFSSAGLGRGLEDPRGQLFKEFVRLAKELEPRFILFENVAGLVTAKSEGRPGGALMEVQRAFESIGYACRFELLNAADFGAPQRRTRLYMMAARYEAVPTFPEATHAREGLLNMLPWVTLRDFLASQRMPDPGDIVRPSAGRLEDLLQLEPGKGLRSGGIVEANRPSGHWGYRQDCFVADLSLPSRTIRAASTPDWIKLVAGDLRRLTWLECAGLQGFSDDWEIVGRVGQRFRQIGNAVQGHIGRAIAAKLLLSAKSRADGFPVSAEWPASFHRRVKYTAMEEVTNGAHRRAARERVHNNAYAATTLR